MFTVKTSVGLFTSVYAQHSTYASAYDACHDLIFRHDGLTDIGQMNEISLHAGNSVLACWIRVGVNSWNRS